MIPKNVGLKVWLYYRLSRDEDKELNSLNNQRLILVDYCNRNGYKIVGESFDDNVTGMTYDRDGMNELMAAAESRTMQAVIVKDFSRFGRHKTLTSVYIDALQQLDIAVISADEGLSTSNENDELVIGIKQVLNHTYVEDLRRKISNGYHSKQKNGGIVIIPPYGYIKHPDKSITIDEECAEVIRKIFELYLDGNGSKKVSEYLNERKIPSPGYQQHLRYGKKVPHNKTKFAQEYLWHYSTVGQVIRNEAYMGTLVNRKVVKNKIKGQRRYTTPDEQYRHENYYPPIISKEIFTEAQVIRKRRAKFNVRAKNQKIHRYAGLIICADCNSVFTAKRRDDYIEYVCNSYHRRGTGYCTPHRIKESKLDQLLMNELRRIKDLAHQNYNEADIYIEQAKKKQRNYDLIITDLEAQIHETKEEISGIIRLSTKDPDNDDIYIDMINEQKKNIEALEMRVRECRIQKEKSEKSKESVKRSIEILDEYLAGGSLTNPQVQAIIDKVIIAEDASNNMYLEFKLKGEFGEHKEVFEAPSNSSTEEQSA